MARLPPPTRESVPANHRAAYDEIVKVRAGLDPGGPSGVMINSPEMAKRANRLHFYLRRESTLSPKVQELAILISARETHYQYGWSIHAAYGRRAGLSDALVKAIRDKRRLPPMADDEATVVNYGRELLRSHKVSDATFQAALQQFGRQGLTELTILIGYFGLLAGIANAFEVDLPANRTEPLMPA